MTRGTGLQPQAPYADLHVHTRASDGTLSPAALIEVAAEVGVGCVAVTDHDTTAGVGEAMSAGARLSVRVLAGCEMTCYRGSAEVHILAYFPGEIPPRFAFLLEALSRERLDRAREMVARLNASGTPLSWGDVLAECRDSTSPGRVHVARALARKGLAGSVAQAWSRFLEEGRPGYVPKRQMTPEEVLGAILDAGGAAALAHPGMGSHDELIAPLAAAGLAAVEAMYPAHGKVNEEHYARLAARYGLVAIGGSDFHGADFHAGVRIGARGCGRDAVEALLARARS
ncbi:MAG: PHP domain-containing protein [Planctomycetota bacterium]|nr:PHP domain-containing protein [Planctomycetota bacterium]